MIFKRTATEICVSFEGMDEGNEKNLAGLIYAGMKIRYDRNPRLEWAKYAKDNKLEPILMYLREFYCNHPFYCREWDDNLWKIY